MPCSENHFIPILDEIRARPDPETPLRKRGRGGPRPGSGPPKGNLNALKHGRFSGRHKRLLEITLAVPEARQALLDIARRNRQRQSKAELVAAYVLMRWLATHNPDFLPRALDGAAANIQSENDQTENDRLTRDLANMELALKRRISRKTTKNRTPKPEERLNAS